MLTFFTTGKAFRGQDGIIQRNALKSWKQLHPNMEVIVFGEDEGAAQVCSELGLVHHPQVEQHASGRNRLDYMFRRAKRNRAARVPLLLQLRHRADGRFPRGFRKGAGLEAGISFRGAEVGYGHHRADRF